MSASSAFTLDELGTALRVELAQAATAFRAEQQARWRELGSEVERMAPAWLEIGSVELELCLQEVRPSWWRRLLDRIAKRSRPVEPQRFCLAPSGSDPIRAVLRLRPTDYGTFEWEELHAAGSE